MRLITFFRYNLNFSSTKRILLIRNENFILPVAKIHAEKIALTDEHSKFRFKDINNLSIKLSQDVLKKLKTNDLKGEKIGVYCNNNYTYLISLLAIWRSNGVPLCLSKLFPSNFLEYFLSDSKCRLVINGIGSTTHLPDFDSLLSKQNVINCEIVEKEFFKNVPNYSSHNIINLNEFKRENNALLLYTSGTSGRPKGVLNTFNNLISSIETMIEAWHWKETDSIISTLPLNHFSGLVYCLLTPFYMRAQVDLLPKFNAEVVWSKLLDESNNLNLFIGVPTIFNQLIDAYNKNEIFNTKYNKKKIQEILKRKMKFIGSGSAPLSVKTYNDWYDLTHYKILERYGMTEIGMALSSWFK